MKITLQIYCLLICIFSGTVFGLNSQNDLFSKSNVISNQVTAKNFNSLWHGYKCVVINSKIPIEAEFALKADVFTQEDATNKPVKIITHGGNANSQFQFKIGSQVLNFDQFGISSENDMRMIRGDFENKAFTLFISPAEQSKAFLTASFFDGFIIIINLDKNRKPIKEHGIKFDAKCYSIASRTQPLIDWVKIED